MKRYNFIEDNIYTLNQLSEQGVEHSTLVFLKKNNIIEDKNEQIQFRFIGSIFVNNNHLVVHPKYRTEFFNQDELSIFHNSLIKFNNTVSLFEGESAGSWKDVYYILNDFNMNGYFKGYQKTFNNDWSNPSWDRMFNQTPNVINKTLYWDEPISTVTTISKDKFKDLHIQIINYLLNTYPVMKNFFPFIIPPPASLIMNSATLLLKIQSEIQTITFLREREILKRTSRILSSTNNNGLIIGTKHVHVFWEQLCKKYTNDISYIWNSYFPKAQWSIKEREGKTSPHKPDIITENDDIISLYDAKYYDTKIHQPGIQDITKQILYANCIKTIKDDAAVHNGFIFPSEDPLDHYSKTTGEIKYDIFGIDTIIFCHHQYDIDIFNGY